MTEIRPVEERSVLKKTLGAVGSTFPLFESGPRYMTVGGVILKTPRWKSVIHAVRADKASAIVDNISDRADAIVNLIGCLQVLYNTKQVFLRKPGVGQVW